MSKSPLLSELPDFVINKLVHRNDYEHFIETAWNCRSATNASTQCAEEREKFFTENVPSIRSVTVNNKGWSRIAYEVRKLKNLPDDQGILAKEELIKEVHGKRKKLK